MVRIALSWRRMNEDHGWAWSACTAYAVGLIATDGCLDGRRPIVSFTSEELELIEQFRTAIGRSPRVYRKFGGFGTWPNQVAIYERPLHSWLLSIGLMPRTTFDLSEIAVPDAYLAPLARGLPDGDGAILSYWHASNRRRYPNHKTPASTRSTSSSSQRLPRAFCLPRSTPTLPPRISGGNATFGVAFLRTSRH
jgi:hypothetical protein